MDDLISEGITVIHEKYHSRSGGHRIGANRVERVSLSSMADGHLDES